MRRVVAFVHRVHRWSGTALSLLMAAWFASGAVMTFKAYPAYTDAERLAHASPLVAPRTAAEGVLLTAAAGERRTTADAEPRAIAESEPRAIAEGEPRAIAAGEPRAIAEGEPRVVLVPRALIESLGEGSSARLTMIEGEPRWLLRDAAGYRALRLREPSEITPLDAARARAEVERTHGRCSGELERIERPDQWTVGRTHPGSYPLLRLACDDSVGLELYVSTRSGEIVQESTRSERFWAWLGPITHWVYPAVLRRERELWRDVVLWLAAVGCVVTLSGMAAGVHAWLRSKRGVKRQLYLRWHQRLGLGFGAMAFTWVFSGALSLEPFHWSSPASELAAAWPEIAIPVALPQQLTAAIESCRSELPDLRELELVAAGRWYALCSDAAAQTRIVDLEDPALTARKRIADEQLHQLAQSSGAQLTLANAADDYYYPTHNRPIARPYARFALQDAAETTLYFDPSTAKLIDQIDNKRRQERWLYHALHSWDLPALYQHRTLWRTTILAAMLTGLTLSLLGLTLFLKKQRRRSR